MAHRIEKIDLLEWGWHKIGDPSKPKGGLLWGNPEAEVTNKLLWKKSIDI